MEIKKLLLKSKKSVLHLGLFSNPTPFVTIPFPPLLDFRDFPEPLIFREGLQTTY